MRYLTEIMYIDDKIQVQDAKQMDSGVNAVFIGV